MTDQTTLSGEEIEALMGRGGPVAGRGGSGTEPRSFTFGSGNVPPSAALPALDRIHDRLARRLRDTFEPMIRVKPKVDAEPAVLRTYRDWQAEQPVFQGISLYSFAPLKGTLGVSVPSAFVGRLVDAFYGGSGAGSAVESKEFTPTEESLFARLSDNLVAQLAEFWRDVSPIQPQLRARETNVALARVAGGEEAVVVCRFTVTPPSGGPAAIDILFPAAALRAVEVALAARSDEGSIKGAEWRAELSSALGDVRIEARTVLARPELSISELVQLKVGDVIPVSIPASVRPSTSRGTVATGSIGEQDGKAALKIERIETRRNAA